MAVMQLLEIRAMVLLSLFSQIILVIFGSKRNYRKGIRIRIIVWSAYMLADVVATAGLGLLARSPRNMKHEHPLEAFWAPFLLMHLGGPDTFTAYSLEDNTLWSRRFLEFVVQVVFALYVIISSWSINVTLSLVATLMFISGIIKYGERIWVLRSASTKKLKESLLSAPDPGPDVVQYLSGTNVRDSEVKVEVKERSTAIRPRDRIPENGNRFKEAIFLFKRLNYLFADLILGYHERVQSYSIINNKSAKDAFQLVSIELRFLYIRLYTKATLVKSVLGVFFRCINFFFLSSALLVFSTAINKDAYSRTDKSITYLLLVWAIVLEVCSPCLLCCARVSSDSDSTKSKKWSGSMAQYNLISFCLKDMPCNKVEKLLCISGLLENYYYLTWEAVNVELQEIIFKELQEKGNIIKDDFTIKKCKELLARRGDYVLKKEKYQLGDDEFFWSTIDIEFDHSLLLWHIATDLCFYDDFHDNNPHPKSKISKCLSDYMLYLLIICPSMLPKGIGEIRYRDTCAEAMIFFRSFDIRWFERLNKREVCKRLLEVNVENISLEEIKGDKCQSVLFYACKLAKQLKLLESRGDWDKIKKWDMITEVWVEILAYAANRCEWTEHGQQLAKGGELLTHVRLLMVHLGLSEQYQIQKKYIIYHKRKSSNFVGRCFRRISELKNKTLKKTKEDPRCWCFACLFSSVVCLILSYIAVDCLKRKGLRRERERE